jgi:uncharacterized protein (TIGR03435 family)
MIQELTNHLWQSTLFAAAAAAALAAPVVIGVMNAPAIRAQSAVNQKFEVAAIKPCVGGGENGGKRGGAGGRGFSPGHITTPCLTVAILIQWAYVNWNGRTYEPSGIIPLEGGPDWVKSARFEIDAKAEGPVGRSIMQGPMIQSLLADRFHLKIHRETREVPVYALTVAKGGPKLETAKPGACEPFDIEKPAPFPPKPGETPRFYCGMAHFNDKGLDVQSATVADVASLFTRLDRFTIDRTGIAGKFDIHLDVTPQDMGFGPPRGAGDVAGPDAEPDFSPIFAAVGKLGLKLVPAKGPREFIVIDSVEKPSEN